MFNSHSQSSFWNPHSFRGDYWGGRECVGQSELLYFFVLVPTSKQSQGGIP